MMLFSRVEDSRGSPDTIDHDDTLLTSSPISDMAEKLMAYVIARKNKAVYCTLQLFVNFITNEMLKERKIKDLEQELTYGKDV